jgi:hypothetical protein
MDARLGAAVRVHERLQVAGGRGLWQRESRALHRAALASERALSSLVSATRRAFARVGRRGGSSSSRVAWTHEALRWALTCPHGHTVGRAFQLYRALLRRASPSDTLRIVTALRQHAEEASGDASGVGPLLEAVLTLDVALRRTPRAELLLVPAALWALVALLGSQYGVIITATSRALRSLFARIPWQNRAAVNVVLAALPPAWTATPINAFSGVLV